MNTITKNSKISLPSLDTRAAIPLYLLVALAAAFAFAFFNGIENLFKRWGEQQELSHGYFLPLIAGWMVWTRRDAILKSLGQPALIGLVGAAVAIVILILTEMTVSSLMVFQHGAMVLLMGSLALALGGRNVFWITLLPVFYLLFMIPPPYWAITVLSQTFQFWSSELGAVMIRMFGIPVYLSGNILDIGDHQLQVADACSGLRYLFPFLSLGFLAAYLFQAPLWQRALVFVSTVPITIVMNSFRVALTGVLVDRWGPEQAEGALHFFEGWVVFLLCMLLLFAVIAFFSRLSGEKDVLEKLQFPDIASKPSATPWNKSIFSRNAVVIIGMLLSAGVYVHFGATNVLKVPERERLASLPYAFPGWRSELQEVDSSIIEVMGADDYIVADLLSPENERFNVYIAYLDMQRHGHSWHSPRQCIPGGGWQITHHDILPTTSNDGEKFYYNRIIIENRGVRQLLYYWYDQRGRRTANEFVMKSLVVLDAVSIQRTDGAMIRILTPIGRGEPVAAADERLMGFMKDLEPKLTPYIPGKTVTATRYVDPDG